MPHNQIRKEKDFDLRTTSQFSCPWSLVPLEWESVCFSYPIPWLDSVDHVPCPLGGRELSGDHAIEIGHAESPGQTLLWHRRALRSHPQD